MKITEGSLLDHYPNNFSEILDIIKIMKIYENRQILFVKLSLLKSSDARDLPIFLLLNNFLAKFVARSSEPA